MLSQNSLQKLFTSNYVSFCFSLKFIENHNILGPRNTHEKKSLTRKIPMGENFGPTKYPREKILNPRNTYQKKFETHETLMRKIFGPSKARRHGGTRPTRPKMAQDPRNLAHSVLSTFSLGGVSTGICRLTVFWFMLVRYHKFKLSTQIEYTSFASVIL